jgi:trimethyllysine dioxygenase
MDKIDCKYTVDESNSFATNTKYQHGFCLVTGVPVDPETTEKLVERITYIRPTHYGGFWDFTADLAMNDTAYTNLYLACHTDGTYWSDTPGLQLFHLLHHDGKGGETMLVDGFKAADELKIQSPESYEILSRTLIPAHSAGEETVCITPTNPLPVLTHHNQTGELVQVRWNNDDRSTMDQWKDPNDVTRFYEAIRLWNKILRHHEIIYKLTPGTCLIFDNWRVLHGRQAFDGSRRMCGAYINRDDFISRFKLLNLGRDEVLRSL